MKKILSVMLLMFAVGANAQFTKVYEAPISGNYKIPWGKVLLNGAYDAEKLNDIYSPYHVYRSGDIVNVLNLETLEIEFKLDLTSVIDTSYYYTYVSFYKNLFKSDKSWSCFLMPYTPTSASFGLDVYDNGKLTKTDIKTTSTFPSLRSGNGKLHLVASSNTSLEVYLVRNDLPQTSTIPYNSSYISALKRISDEHEAKLFNAVGQKIDDAYYGTLPNYLKKTIYAK